jgi:hypothetical protein
LASFCVWTKLLVCKDAFLQGIPLFRSGSDVSALLSRQKISKSLSAVWTTCHPVRTPICPLFHPFGRRVTPSGRLDRSSINCPDDVHSRLDLHCFEKPLYQLASVRTSQQPVLTPFSDRAASDSFQIQFKGRLLQPFGRRGFPSRHAHT